MKAALPYAMKIQPHLSVLQQQAIHNALQLSSLCSNPFVPVAPAAPNHPVDEAAATQPSFFVDATKGADSNTGQSFQGFPQDSM